MPFNTLGLSVATVGAATLALAIAAPASAQEHYGQRHYTHTHYAHAHYQPLRPLSRGSSDRRSSGAGAGARPTSPVPWERWAAW